MRIGEMFYKPIDRDIKGVIKVGQGDDSNVYQELEEYVVTRELAKHFSDFFEAYKKSIVGTTDKMGVWISGFFGSGKSHFLKILSYLLENKEVNGKKAIEYFKDKIYDSMVLADMKLAGDISADVILFNIDSKSDSDSKANKDAIVKVFNKVFNEMQGFCGSMPWIADLERQMVMDGVYEDFKKTFKEISGREWQDAREDFYYEEDAIVEALSKSTKMSIEAARNWYAKAERNYSLSVEKFARRVREYIERKGKNHHVIFLVDEIGQYIGDNSQLMLNLQTVVEDLGTECGGKAWVIVTSQQDIDSVTKVKGNDFSKIQGRFNTRLSLSSANVDEVIRKRILLKNDVAKDTLKLLYENKDAILKNLITFSQDTPEKKIYKDNDDFAECYPFIPYQFYLLQQVLTSVRIHGSSGKHLAEGERSMISSFQESAIKYMNHEEGTIIPFSAFYDTIEAFLDSNIRTVIIHAQENDNLNDFDVELLKVLFMIKYLYMEIPANKENLATLMVSHIDEDKIGLAKKIDDSLKRLIKETLVQRNGDQYIFLTYEEQEINREIKDINVDLGEVIQKVSEIIFDEIYTDKKYKYSTRYNFSFNQVVDDRFFRGNQGNDIGLKIITPYYDTGVELTDNELKLMSAREKNLIIKLPNNTAFLDETEEILQIETFLHIKGGTSLIQKIEEIKDRKRREQMERKERVKSLLTEAIRNADMYANSQRLEIKEKHPVERINDGFKVLIEGIYTKLGYITCFTTTKDLYDIFADNEQISLNGVESPNKLALDEVAGYIERNTTRSIPVTMKTILSIYGKAPYGWLEEDIEWLIAKLFKAQEVKLQLNSQYLDVQDREIVKYLTKRDYADRLLIEKRIKVPAHQINNAKELFKEIFGKMALLSDEDGLMRQFMEYANKEISKINELLVYYRQSKYPGQDILQEGKETLEKICKIHDAREFYDELQREKDVLLDYADDSIDVKKFFDSNQKEFFDKAVHKINVYNSNKTYVLDKEVVDLVGQMQKIVGSREPYSDIHKLPSLIDRFVVRFTELLEEECKPVRKVIESDYTKVLEELNKYEFKPVLFDRFKNRFDDLLSRLDHANNFYEAIAMKEESDRLKLRCFDEIAAELAKRKPAEPPTTKEPDKPTVVNDPPRKYKKTVNISIANILHGAKSIESESDIEDVVNEIRNRLKRELRDDVIIKLV
jgi:hypothetical protein